MKLVTRDQWGARAPKSITRIEAVTSVSDHWEGPSVGIFSHDHCAPLVKGIQSYHMDHNGWADIAYNAVVCPHGYVFEGRWLGARSAANGTNDANDHSYAVCGLRGEGDPFTDPMKVAFHEVHELFFANGAGRQVWGHQHWYKTSCPGPDQMAWINAGCPIQADAHALGGDTTLTTSAIRLHTFEDGGYWVFAADGGVFAFNGAPFHGSLGGVRLNGPIVAALPKADKSGYTLVGADGGIFAYGSARSIVPYQGLMAEYARGERRVVDAQETPSGIVLLSNLAERYQLT